MRIDDLIAGEPGFLLRIQVEDIYLPGQHVTGRAGVEGDLLAIAGKGRVVLVTAVVGESGYLSGLVQQVQLPFVLESALDMKTIF